MAITTKELELVLSKLDGVRENRDGYQALCPAHEDHEPSLSVSVGRNGAVVLYCHAGCEFKTVLDAIGLTISDLSPNGNKPSRVVATYDYTDEDGAVLYQTVRFEPKGFSQRKPDGAGGWDWTTKGVRLMLYRLPELLVADSSEWVFVCEGEKSADAVAGLGFTATTAAMGAGKWHVGGTNYTDPLRGRKVAVLPDNDIQGLDHAEDVARSLVGIGDAVRVIELPGLARKEDPWDWVAYGGTAEKLLQLVDNASDYTPSGDGQGKIPHRLGAKLPGDKADEAMRLAPMPPDPEIRNAILDALLCQYMPRELRPPVALRRQKAGSLLLRWLHQHGGFVQSETSELYYFFETQRRLFDLSTDRWAAWLYAVTGANPAGTDYAYLLVDCKVAALSAPVRQIVRVAHWDDDARVLRVSRFDGTVYVLDGDSISEEPNGEHIIFNDAPGWLPYAPDFSCADPGVLKWLSDLPNWTADAARRKAVLSLGFRVWVLTTFFTELCPSRPHAVFIGEKGSGKSMALRMLLKLMFGPVGELSGVPDKPDGFTAAAAAAHVLVLDNLDQFTGWLRDKLARIATGSEDYYRKLYTSNERGRVVYRCWMGFTARTPDTLRRDDLADRLLLLPVDRFEDHQRRAETVLLNDASAFRDGWWSDVLLRLNAAVAAIRRGAMPRTSKLRMADWEMLGRVFARNEGNEPLWDELVAEIERSQSDFLLEGDLIVDGLELWMKDEKNHGREVTSRILYSELAELLFTGSKPPADWPKSTSAFGRRLAGIRRELRTVYDVAWETKSKRKLVYTFGVKQ